jgi:hypothetical protein
MLSDEKGGFEPRRGSEPPPMPVPVRVESYAGYKAEEYPKAFSIGDRSFRVDRILDRWYGADHAYFKVRTDDGGLYILRYDQGSDAWELVYMDVLGDRDDDFHRA